MNKLCLATSLAIALLCAVSYAQPAFADAPPPVKINQCVMGPEKIGDDTIIGHGVSFTNVAHHQITAVRFKFSFETPFGDDLGDVLETDTGSFAPGVVIDHTHSNIGHQLLANPNLSAAQTYYWNSQNPTQDPIDHIRVKCTVDAVSFEDGAVWRAH